MEDEKMQNTSVGENISPISGLEEKLTGRLPYTLMNDFMFKACLQENEAALRGLICALLSLESQEIHSIVITNPIKYGQKIDAKTLVLDIKLVLNNNQFINLEMQVANLGNWPERSLTYLCRMFDHLKHGEDYNNVKKVIHIGILDFTPADFPEELYAHYTFCNKENGHIYSDKIGIYMLQLNQLGNLKDKERLPDLYHWAQLFRATTWEEIQMLGENNKVIKDSIVTLKYLTADEEMQMQMEARERYRRDMEASRRLGLQENEKQLKEQEKRLAEQQETIAEQQGTINEQQGTINEQRETIAEKQETINKMNSESLAKDKEIMEQAKEIERLKQLLSESETI